MTILFSLGAFKVGLTNGASTEIMKVWALASITIALFASTLYTEVRTEGRVGALGVDFG
jgi:hypothetical protein